MVESIKGILVKKKEITKDLFILWIKPSHPLLFEPGQYLTLGKDGIERPYSIFSSPHEENIEIFLELVPKSLTTEKSLSPKLFSLKLGDDVDIRPRTRGKFVLETEAETHIMLATVTGIAPFISMVRAYLHGHYKQKFEKPWYIFHGASYQDEFGYTQELTQATQTGKIIYIPTISRPQDPRNQGWKSTTGRVNLIIDDYLKKYTLIPNNKTMAYLCGNKGMIEYLGNKRVKPDLPLGKLVQAGYKVREEVFF